MRKDKTILVAGKFDPIHQGHIDHIERASRLGDYLYIVTHIDEAIVKQKGYCAVPLQSRILLLKGLLLILGIRGEVIVAEPADSDGTIANTLRRIKPDILAKGGDRVPGNMPLDEIDACKAVNCEIVYGIGALLNSSSEIIRREDENRNHSVA